MSEEQQPIKTALFSVTDKSGLVDFASHLFRLNPSLVIIASGGTAKVLEEHGINTLPIEKYTGFPECFSGRVKTLHPAIAGGILYKRGRDEREAEELGILPIDLVVCNLYRFQEAVKKGSLTTDELIEEMDIGGSTLIRSAIKNYRHVAIVTDPKDYPSLIEELTAEKGALTLPTRERLAVKAAALSAEYEAAISKELAKRFSSEELYSPLLRSGKKLRYGENPDQEAWIYRFDGEGGVANGLSFAGKELSYNNYEDAAVANGAALELGKLALFASPDKNFGRAKGVAIVKHGSLCGYATGPTLADAFERAWEGDSKSAFGSVISCTEAVTEELIECLKNRFIEVLIAPEFSQGFIDYALKKKPNLRLLAAPLEPGCSSLVHKNVSGGMLVQTKKELNYGNISALLREADAAAERRVGVVTRRSPGRLSGEKLAFAIAAVTFAKSNAIAIVREWREGFFQLLGVGSGQPNRVDSLQRLALPKAIDNLAAEGREDIEKALGECVLASDGFFPFDDSIRYAAKCGIRCCIQPGGSIRDDEVIEAADELGMSMIFTGERYFTH